MAGGPGTPVPLIPMTNPAKTLLAGCAFLAILAAAPASAASGADPALPALPAGDAFDCAALAPGLCEEIALLLASVAAPETALAVDGSSGQFQLVALYQDVYPNGQWGEFDCIYDNAANRSIIVERWSVHVEAGTLNGSTRNPIVNMEVFYPFVEVATGDQC